MPFTVMVNRGAPAEKLDKPPPRQLKPEFEFRRFHNNILNFVLPYSIVPGHSGPGSPDRYQPHPLKLLLQTRIIFQQFIMLQYYYITVILYHSNIIVQLSPVSNCQQLLKLSLASNRHTTCYYSYYFIFLSTGSSSQIQPATLEIVAAMASTISSSCFSSGPSAITRTLGSVPDGLTKIRPLSPSNFSP